MRHAECWFRNPGGYIRELIELSVGEIVFDRGYTRKRNIDPHRYCTAWMPAHIDWRCLHVGDQGTAEYTPGSSSPVAVYPTWQYGVDPLELLLFFLTNPAGDDPGPYTVDGAAPDEIPVAGQEHRVVLTDLPFATDQLYPMLAEIQLDHPDAIMHIHGLYSFRTMFGLGFGAADVDARTDASKGNLWLPNGKFVRPPDLADWHEWINLLGYSTEDMKDAKMRCKYTIRSAQWAASHWGEPHPFRMMADKSEDVDTSTPPASYKPNLVRKVLAKTMKETTAGDMIACDVCSLASSCKAYRAGSVCTLPDSDGMTLAKHFQTRDSAVIITGLQDIIALQASRAEMGRHWEMEEGELSSEVTRILDGMFTKGVQLAKLVDPKLGAKQPLVQINQQGVSAIEPSGTGQVVARAIAQLEEAGYAREDITKTMVDEVIRTGNVPLEIGSGESDHG